MKKVINLTLLFFILFSAGFSQSVKVAGIKKFSSNGFGSIVNDGQVQGYYLFYLKDKVSKGISSYDLVLYNNNLEATHKIEITKPSHSLLLEAAFNGERLCFSFVNQKMKTLELDLYDLNGKKTSTYTVNDVSSTEMNYYINMTQLNDEFRGSLLPVPNKGFIRYGYEKDGGYRVTIEYIDNSGNKTWATEPFSKEKKSFETTEPVFANSDVAISNIGVRSKMMSSDIDMNMVAHDVSSGKELFRFPLENENSFQMVMGVNYDESEKQYLLFGEYYGKTGSGKLDVKNKLGFFMQIYNDKGDLVKEKFSSWAQDMSSIIPVKSKGKLENDALVFIHTVIKTADGNYFAIGEQFKKKVSGKAMLVNAAGGEAALMEIQMMDMMVFKFDNELKPVTAYFIEKKKSHILLPKGFSTVSVHKLGFVMKLYGYFDYAFTTRSKDKTTFNSVYINYVKDKTEDTNVDVGTIYYQDKDIKVDHIKLNTKPSNFYIIPAKNGYISILEYHRKEKYAEFRLEKLDI